MSFRPSGSSLSIKEGDTLGGALYRDGCASRVRPARGGRGRPGPRRRSDCGHAGSVATLAAELRTDDEAALEATGNSDAITNLMMPIVGRVVVSNAAKTRATSGLAQYGSIGPMRPQQPPWEHWLLVRRHKSKPDQRAYPPATTRRPDARTRPGLSSWRRLHQAAAMIAHRKRHRNGTPPHRQTQL